MYSQSIVVGAVRQTAPIAVRYIHFGVMEIFNCDKYAACQCQIGTVCYDLAMGLGLGLRIMYRVRGLGLGIGIV